MKIKQITDLGGARFKISLEGGITFILYKKELEKWIIIEGGYLSEEDYQEIKEGILIKRAKKRGMYLLEKQGRSKNNLISKLQEGYYPEEVINEAIDYIESYGYLDDNHLARDIVENRMYQKSYQEIIQGLRLKGIEPETINAVLEKYYDEDGEREAIKYLMRKKRIDVETITTKEKAKFFNYLARKGFSYDSIQQSFRG